MDTTYAPGTAKALETALGTAKMSGKTSLAFNYPIGMTSENEFPRVDLSDALRRVAAAGGHVVNIQPVPAETMPGYIDHARLTIALGAPTSNAPAVMPYYPTSGHVPASTFPSHVRFEGPKINHRAPPPGGSSGTPMFE